jgi:serine carboxypeptidase-like clade 2
MNSGAFLLIIALLAVLNSAAPEQDHVPSLKGYYDFSKEFKMYSGTLKIQENPLISAHYLFVTSKDAPATDDLVLWLNGGPGCSSLLGTHPFI